MSSNLRAAILQSNFVCGGTSRVSLAAIELFNQMGIAPDVFCFHGLTREEVRARFGRRVRFDLRLVPDWGMQCCGALKGPLLNYLFRRFSSVYELVFNAHGYLHGLPGEECVVHYLPLPRKVELLQDQQSQGALKRWLYTRPVIWFYQLERVNPGHCYRVNSQYSYDLLMKHYDIPPTADVDVLYPPVNLDEFWCHQEKRSASVVSVASFDPTKNQLAQIEIATSLPEYQFYLVGDTSLNHGYYQECERRIDLLGVSNVHLCPDASLAELRRLLRNSRFFLHTKQGEHFGIAAVEAIAAGCVPLVPDSGGQRETVPDDRLRFKSVGEVPGIVRGLRSSEINGIRRSLQEHVRRFDQDVFKQGLREAIRSATQGRRSR